MSKIDPAMLEAFDDQLTDDTLRTLLEAAAAALIEDAITDTLTGDAGWEPGTVPLASHLAASLRRAIGDRDGGPLGDRDRVGSVSRHAIAELSAFARVRLELAWRAIRAQRRGAAAATGACA